MAFYIVITGIIIFCQTRFNFRILTSFETMVSVGWRVKRVLGESINQLTMMYVTHFSIIRRFGTVKKHKQRDTKIYSQKRIQSSREFVFTDSNFGQCKELRHGRYALRSVLNTLDF